MNLFRRARSRSPSIPKLCVHKEKEKSPGNSGSGSDSVRSTSLEVPTVPRIRSSSFDTSSLHQQEPCDDNQLKVPDGQRTRSLDSACSSDDISDRESYSLKVPGLPKYYRRRSLDIPRLCIHCVHIESLSSQEQTPNSSVSQRRFNYSKNSLFDLDFPSSDSSASDNSDATDESDSDVTSDDDACSTRSGSFEVSSPTCRRRRHRKKQPKGALTRQYSFEEDLNSSGINVSTPGESSPGAGHTVVTLQVPNVKPRSSSMDGCIPSPIAPHSMDLLNVPGQGKQQRSTSVDISLPTADDNHYQPVQTK